MNIELIEKQNYGNTMLYVKDTELGRVISQLTGKKTISHGDIIALKTLGHKISLAGMESKQL